jgi:AcrR family transcriptional regulator
MTHQMRTYRKTRRAESEARTVQRITEAAFELHGTLGPSQTSMSAVARRAGVRRSTLYRHFADEAALFQACTGHFMTQQPFPALECWSAIADPDERLATALGELYAYYGRTERMMANVHRDEDVMPIVREMLGGYRGYIAAARDIMLRGRHARGNGSRRLAAAVGHALAFTTWRSLARGEGLDDREAAAMMCRLVTSAGQRSKN